MNSFSVLTLNIWQEQGPWERRMALLQRQLEALAPDLICLQEVRQVPARVPNQAQSLARALGLQCEYETAQPWGGGDEGLAILSRLPIAARALIKLPSDAQTQRLCLGVRVDLPPPTGRTLWIFTTHLAYRMQDGLLREQQVRAVDRFVRETAAGELAVLAGDFNAVAEADEIRYLSGLTSLEGERTYYQDAYALCHPGSPGWTWPSANPYTRALSTLPADRRLDYIFVSPRRRDGAARVLGCEIVCDRPDDAGTFCSDHYGVMATISL